MNNLKGQIIDAMKWSYLSLFINMSMQFVFAAVLARLLGPKAYGIMAIALSLQRFGLFIADFGMGQAIVQKKQLSEIEVRAGFTSSVLLGLLATSLGWLASPLVGKYTGDPAVVPVFQGLASSYMLISLVLISTSLLRRAMKFKPLMIAETSSYVIGHGICGIGAAYLGFGAFSIVISVVAQNLIQLAVTYGYSLHSLKFTFNWSAYRSLYGFGTRATLVSFLEFISQSLDTFLIIRLYDAVALGLYNGAYRTVEAPLSSFARSLIRVLAPSLSAVQHDQERLRRTYLSALLALSMILFSAAFVIFVSARDIVLVMLGGRFVSAIPIVQVFALFIPFPVLTSLSGTLAEATARLNTKIAIQATYFIFLAGAYWLAYRLGYGVISFAVVLFAAAVLRNLVYSFVAHRIIGQGGRIIARAYGVGVLCGLAIGGVTYAVIRPLRARGTSSFALLALEIFLGASLLGLAIVFGPDTELKSLAHKLFRRLPGRPGRWLSRVSGARKSA